MRTALVAALAALLLAAPGASHAKKPRGESGASLPAWAREASARATPDGAAGSVLLHDEKIVEPLAAGGVRVTLRQVTRVLDAAGVDDVGSVMVAYSKDDVVQSHEAWTLLPGGEVRQPHPKDDVVEIPYTSAGYTVDDTLVRIITVPAVQVGAIVVEESVVRHALDLGADDFAFGRDLDPVALARLELRVPAGWSIQLVTRRAEGLAEQRGENGVSLEGRNLAPLAQADLRPPARELLPVAWVRWWSPDGARGFADWNAVARWNEQLGAPELAKAAAAAPVAERLKPRSPEDFTAAVARAHDFAARDVRYVAIEIGIGGYRPASPDEVCTKRYGDCKGKTWLLRALASRWGAAVYPTLVRTRDLGPLLPDVPTPGQFNHVIAGIALPDGIGADLWATATVDVPGRGPTRLLFVDATASEADAFTLPSGDQGTLALVVSPAGGVLATLPTQPPSASVTARTFTARLDASLGVVEGTLVESWTGAEASAVRSWYSGRDDAERRAAQAEYLQRRFPGTSVVLHETTGLDDVESAVVDRTVLSGGRFGKSAGDLRLVLPGSIASGPLTGRLPPGPRAWPLRFATPRTDTLEARLELPEGLRPESLPEPVEQDGPHVALRTSWSFADAALTYRREAVLKAREIAPEDYGAFREALGRLQSQDSAAVVFVPR